MNTKSDLFTVLVIGILVFGMIGIIVLVPELRMRNLDNTDTLIAGGYSPYSSDFIVGADISTYHRLLENNVSYYYGQDNTEGAMLGILHYAGFNLARVRVWTNDSSDYSLPNALLISKAALEAGYKVMIDFHFSDTWADPAHQSLPAAWENASFSELTGLVYDYVNDSLSYLADNGVVPSYVQIGNEVSNGFLWDYGRVNGDYNNDTQWEHFSELLNSAVKAVRTFSEIRGENVSVVIHTDLVKAPSEAVSFYGKLIDLGVDFDIIGLSYYPWWHGGFTNLNNTLWWLWDNFSKPLMIVETAYPWTLDWCDETSNIVGSQTQLLPDFPATVDGQKAFLQELARLLLSLPTGAVKGMIYWEPGWVCSDGFGSPWENMALFDFNHHALDSMYFYTEML